MSAQVKAPPITRVLEAAGAGSMGGGSFLEGWRGWCSGMVICRALKFERSVGGTVKAYSGAVCPGRDELPDMALGWEIGGDEPDEANANPSSTLSLRRDSTIACLHMRFELPCTCRGIWSARSASAGPATASHPRQIHLARSPPVASTSALPPSEAQKGKAVERWPGWKPTIGLELHVQLKGNVKLLSRQTSLLPLLRQFTDALSFQRRLRCTKLCQILTLHPSMLFSPVRSQ